MQSTCSHLIISCLVLFTALCPLAAAALSPQDYRRWIITVKPTNQLSRVAPDFQGGDFVVDLCRGGEVVLNGAVLNGHWETIQHPYELLDKLYDRLLGQFYSDTTSLHVTGRLWDRALRRGQPRRLTHGVVTLRTEKSSAPRLVVATLCGREVTE